jgi:hypothetical protein
MAETVRREMFGSPDSPDERVSGDVFTALYIKEGRRHLYGVRKFSRAFLETACGRCKGLRCSKMHIISGHAGGLHVVPFEPEESGSKGAVKERQGISKGVSREPPSAYKR